MIHLMYFLLQSIWFKNNLANGFENDYIYILLKIKLFGMQKYDILMTGVASTNGTIII